MKLILSLSSLVLVFLISALGLHKPIDYTGIYSIYAKNPKIVKEEIKLNEDFTFVYNLIAIDASVSTLKIKGTYKVSRKKIKLFPNFFGDKKNPHKRTLTRFESGEIRLQPTYHLRQWKDQLSLCLQDVKRDLLLPKFVKIEE